MHIARRECGTWGMSPARQKENPISEGRTPKKRRGRREPKAVAPPPPRRARGRRGRANCQQKRVRRRGPRACGRRGRGGQRPRHGGALLAAEAEVLQLEPAHFGPRRLADLGRAQKVGRARHRQRVPGGVKQSKFARTARVVGGARRRAIAAAASVGAAEAAAMGEGPARAWGRLGPRSVRRASGRARVVAIKGCEGIGLGAARQVRRRDRAAQIGALREHQRVRLDVGRQLRRRDARTRVSSSRWRAPMLLSCLGLELRRRGRLHALGHAAEVGGVLGRDAVARPNGRLFERHDLRRWRRQWRGRRWRRGRSQHG